MPTSTVDTVLASVVSGGMLLGLTAIGWYLRRFTATVDGLVKIVADLVTHSEVIKQSAPGIERRLTDAEDVIEENRTYVAVLRDWRLGHDRLHESPRPT